MGVWAVLRNIGTVISFFKTISKVIGNVAETKKMPPKELLKELLDGAEALLDSGAIDIPGVDEAAISDSLKQIEAQICG